MRKPRLVVLVLVATALATGCSSSSSPPGAGPDGKKDKERRPDVEWTGPNFEVTTFEGETFELAAQAGRPVVLNFWESW